ncbi:MAG TPA: citramalate synthase [Thermoleophilia bacterium]|nr:citramalate synthase [Thermoleophilia bacterium]
MAGSAVTIYDTTLRDGLQQEGLSVSVDEKVRIALKLDELGLQFIEGGFPASNPKETAFFARMEHERLRHATLVAFGTTRRKGVAAEADTNLRVLAEASTPVVAIVGKSWGLHLRAVLHVSRDENLRMIADSVAFLVAQGKRVVFDAEHFFDAWADDAAYALRTLRAAGEAGAELLCLCDTSGATLPPTIEAVVSEVGRELGTPLGVHCHNDADCAVANSLVAVAAGAAQVQGTINGYGERCGNANLTSIIPALKLKMGLPVVSDEQLERLAETAHFVAEVVNVTPWAHQPYVGRSAFTHKGGLHVAAVEASSETFEHVDPARVGNEQRVLISELSGKGAVLRKAHELGFALDGDDERVGRILRRLKQKEHEGFHYEAADASFDLFLHDQLGGHRPLFRLESFRVIVEKREDGHVVTEATVKVHVGDERIIATGEGNGPVNALDTALRLAIVRAYPHLGDIDLVNYKVRILDENKGTGAVTRVLLDASDGERTWGSIGVSENIIEASWQALVDSIEYGMLHGRPAGEHESAPPGDAAEARLSAPADDEAGQ